MNDLLDLINPIDVDVLRKQASEAKPFPHFCIDNFLDKDFANEVYDAFPDYDEAIRLGHSFNALNEAKKVQIIDSKLFPAPVAKLNELLSSEVFVKKIGSIFNIPDLLPDTSLTGGGIHETREGGRLDVHVDFNFNKQLGLYRRVNILIYFNKDWKYEYGGLLDLWDDEVKKCYAEILPIFNRMVCFATSEISYHGVTPLKCPQNTARKSYASYYYSVEPSSDWNGMHHTTIFKARPSEWMRGHVHMPMDNIKRKIKVHWQSTKNLIKSIIRK